MRIINYVQSFIMVKKKIIINIKIMTKIVIQINEKY